MKLRFAALLFAAQAVALHVHAADTTPSASASVSNFRFTLADLDIDDRNFPSLSYVMPLEGYEDGWASAGAQYGPQRTEVTYSERTYQIVPGQTVSHGTAHTEGSSTLSTSSTVGGLPLGSLALSATASASNSNGMTWATADARSPAVFHLSPYTALTITFELSANSANLDAEAPGYAESWARVAVFTSGATPSFFEEFEVRHALGADRFGDIGEAGTRFFMAQLSSGAETLEVHVEASAVASVQAISPVPEPHTWGMLLGGLALVGAAGARARRHRQA